jgi:hypothetical protein
MVPAAAKGREVRGEDEGRERSEGRGVRSERRRQKEKRNEK